MSDISQPESPDGQAFVNLGARRISATRFTLFSGEARMQLAALNEEFETLIQHGVVSDGLMEAVGSLAEVAGDAQMAALADLAGALGRALAMLSLDAVSESEEALVREAVEEVDRSVMQTLDLVDPSPATDLIRRLERVASGLLRGDAEPDPAGSDAPETRGGPAAAPPARSTSGIQSEPWRVFKEILAEEKQVGGKPAGEVFDTAVAAVPQEMDAAAPKLLSGAASLRDQLSELERQLESWMETRMERARASQETLDPAELERFRRIRQIARAMTDSVDDLQTSQRRLVRALDEAREMLDQVRMLAADSPES